jgi:hypothetical protein
MLRRVEGRTLSPVRHVSKAAVLGRRISARQVCELGEPPASEPAEEMTYALPRAVPCGEIYCRRTRVAKAEAEVCRRGCPHHTPTPPCS